MNYGAIKFGQVVVAKFIYCRQNFKAKELDKHLRVSAAKVGAQYLGSLRHDFKPLGSTAVILLAESHYAIHTWPENKTVTGVFYTCGNINSLEAMKETAKRLEAERVVGVIFCYDCEQIIHQFDFKLKEK